MINLLGKGPIKGHSLNYTYEIYLLNWMETQLNEFTIIYPGFSLKIFLLRKFTNV